MIPRSRRFVQEKHFFTITVEFETLKKEFDNTSELGLRHCLLFEMQSKLLEMNELLDRACDRLRITRQSS